MSSKLKTLYNLVEDLTSLIQLDSKNSREEIRIHHHKIKEFCAFRMDANALALICDDTEDSTTISSFIDMCQKAMYHSFMHWKGDYGSSNHTDNFVYLVSDWSRPSTFILDKIEKDSLKKYGYYNIKLQNVGYSFPVDANDMPIITLREEDLKLDFDKDYYEKVQ